MRISQKLEYAFRALAQLAQCFDTSTITRLEEIAQREAVSANFLVQILNDLRKAGIVISKRGKMGGYQLAKNPRQISLFNIVEAVEPTLTDQDVSKEGVSGEKVAQVWKTISCQFNADLKKVTLEELIAEEEGEMFYI